MRNLTVSIPTLGARPEMLIETLTSLSQTIDLRSVEICTPNRELVLVALRGTEFKDITIIQDPANQAHSILNSWNRNPSKWYSWINDDDLANPSMSQIIGEIILKDCASPMVCFGNFAILKEMNVSNHKTPCLVSHNMLRYGGNYIPGIMTFINFSAAELLLKHRQSNPLFKDSFDYQWWLVLTSLRTKFKHVNGALGFWRDHPFARTVHNKEVGDTETTQLKRLYQKHPKNSAMIRFLRVNYKLLAKILSI